MGITTGKRVKYVHPGMSRLPMTGHVEFSKMEGEDLFYPDAEFSDRLLKLYGFEPEAGLSLDDAEVTPL